MLRRSLAVLVAVSAMLMVLVGPVSAADTNLNTLTATCDNGQTITFQFTSPAASGAFPRDLKVLDSASTFTIHEFIITNLSTGDTFTIGNVAGVEQNKILVACSRTGNAFQFTWLGFFTPNE